MGNDAVAPDGRLSDASDEVVEGDEATRESEEATEEVTSESSGEAAEESESPESTEDPESADADADADAADTEAAAPAGRRRHSFPKKPRRKLTAVGWTLIGGLVFVLALGAVAGWLGYRVYQDREAQERRDLYVSVGRQGALNLTTIDYTRVDEDVKRILDSATGGFYDEFQGRAQPFSQVVTQVKSKSVGNVTEAGLESESDEGGEVLVAVTVNTTVDGQPDQGPRAWRMRLLVQQTGEGEAKVANVEFVP